MKAARGFGKKSYTKRVSYTFRDKDCIDVNNYFNVGELVEVRGMTGTIYVGIYLGVIMHEHLKLITGFRHTLMLHQGYRTCAFLLSNILKVTKLTEVDS